MSCNHISRVNGEILPNWSLAKRILKLHPHEFCWLRPGEKVEAYEVCPKCHAAVRKKALEEKKDA